MAYRAGMFVYALAFTLGVILVQQLSELPERWVVSAIIGCVLCLSVFLLICYKTKLNSFLYYEITLSIFLIVLFLLGIVYSILFSESRLENKLAEDLAGKTIVLSGIVSSIPKVAGNVQRFTVDVDGYRSLNSDGSEFLMGKLPVSFPRKVRLSWYYGSKVNAAERWVFEVRLKPPHGFYNPAGFDYESWLFLKGIDATGYIRQSESNQRLKDQSEYSVMRAVNRYRQSVADRIDSASIGRLEQSGGLNSIALVKALAIGDKTSISSEQWSVLINTGTSHLMAISGLHVGLAALFAYLSVRRLTPSFVMKRVPVQHVAVVCGLVVAVFYSLAAGLSIPTQRAIIMLSVVSIMVLSRHNHRPFDALGCALIVVLLFDPLAVLAVGFWFSFAAVAVIFISLNSTKSPHKSFLARVVYALQQWIKLQLTITLFLLPLSLFMFQQVSLVSPAANFLLIPYVSFIVVPVVLLGLIVNFVSTGVADYIFLLSAWMLDIIWPVLRSLSELPYAVWVQGDVGIVLLLLLSVIIWMAFLMITNKVGSEPKQLTKNRSRYSYSILFTGCLLAAYMWLSSDNPALEEGEFYLTVLDVGQGSAAVLHTENHVMVFDAGNKFSNTLDAGKSVVIPYLRSRGVRAIDVLVISHGDGDHIGGADALLDEFPDTAVIGQGIQKLDTTNQRSCYRGLKWQWDDVNFEFLSPDRNAEKLLTEKPNNRSCVLRVSSVYGSMLFTGDAEKEVEARLLEEYGVLLKADVLIVPHHGSSTSSGSDFLASVGPKISIFSVGYKNRYGLPSQKVLERYDNIGSLQLQTAQSGAISVGFSEKSGINVEKYRETGAKYWNHIVP